VKVLGLVGSPRRRHFTDRLVTAVLDGAGAAGAECEKLYLRDLQIKFCLNCDYCRTHPTCAQKDEMIRLGRLFEEVDGIVLGAPTYYYELNALTKAFVDRCYQFTRTEVDPGARRVRFISRIERRKRGVFVGVSGSYGPEVFEKQVRIVRACFRHINAELVATVLLPYTDWMPLEPDAPPLRDALVEARAVGERLVAGP